MLPIRFVTGQEEVGAAPVITVDGSYGSAPEAGLHLAHWPGNRTPAPLRRDLSTEIAFAFLDLDGDERAALTEGCQSLVLNHYDTDGVCAIFVLTRGDEALRQRDLLVDVAAAGDFFESRSDRAFAIDAALRNLADPDRSELAVSLAGSEPGERKQRLLEAALELLGALLEDEATALGLWGIDVEALHADRADLDAALHDDIVYLDLAIWTGPPGRGSTRAHAPETARTSEAFDPGRHAFLGTGRHDRALLLGPGPRGTTARLVLGTRSFFDVVTSAPSPRPDLIALARKLNAREDALDPGREGDTAWRFQDPAGASPELWFGKDGLPLYVEHAGPWLAESQLDPSEIKRTVLDAVRDAWVLPDDDDEADEDEDIFAV